MHEILIKKQKFGAILEILSGKSRDLQSNPLLIKIELLQKNENRILVDNITNIEISNG